MRSTTSSHGLLIETVGPIVAPNNQISIVGRPPRDRHDGSNAKAAVAGEV